MNFITFLVKDTMQRKTRLLLTLFGVSVGISVCIIMLSLGRSIRNSFSGMYDSRRIDLIVEEKDQLSILLSKVDDSLEQELRALSCVEDAAAVLVYIHRIKSSPVPVYGWSAGSFLFDAVEFIEGGPPQQGKYQVAVGQPLMEQLGSKSITLKGEEFSVVGIFRSVSPLENFAIVVPLADLQQLTGQEKKATLITVKLHRAAQARSQACSLAAQEIEKSFPDVSALSTEAFIAEKTKFIILGEKFSWLVSFITIIAVILGLANAMVTSAFEKRRFLAILIALGWQKWEVAAFFLCQAVLVALGGGLIGMFIGFKGTDLIFRLTDISAFAPVWDIPFIIKLIGIILASGIAAAVVPMWVAIHANPVETIRNG